MPVTFTAIVLTGMNSIRVFDVVAAMGGSGPAIAIDTLASICTRPRSAPIASRWARPSALS